MSDVEELTITAKDRCDKCGAQAYFMPILDSGDLLFCRHHFMENKEIKTYRLIIKGKVQNVGFRHWFSDLAISLGLNGYVQNKESKDEVEAIIQGDMQSILSITEKSKTGPEMALVEGVIPSSIISNVTYSGFIVKYETD